MLTVYFDCPECGLVKAKAEVPAREGTHQDVVFWMREVVIPAVCMEHDKLSPNCHPKSLKNLMFTAPENAEFIGQQIE